MPAPPRPCFPLSEHFLRWRPILSRDAKFLASTSPSTQLFLTCLADPSLDQAQPLLQFPRVQLVLITRTYITLIFSRTAVAISRLGLASTRVWYSGERCPSWPVHYSRRCSAFWALSYSSVSVSAAGLRSDVVPHELGRCVAHGVYFKTSATADVSAELCSPLYTLQRFRVLSEPIHSKTSWAPRPEGW